jgi:predicted DNA-binding ribbon-helix-helix protein
MSKDKVRSIRMSQETWDSLDTIVQQIIYTADRSMTANKLIVRIIERFIHDYNNK